MKISEYIIYLLFVLFSVEILSFLFFERCVLNIYTFFPLSEKNGSMSYRMHHLNLLGPH